MPNLRGSELIIIVLLVMLLFGAKRMPDAARSLGRSLRIFKTETKGLVSDDPAEGDLASAPQPAPSDEPATNVAPVTAPPQQALSAPTEPPTRA